MTIQELYQMIGGDYEQAKRVLRVDKLIDKHIRKLTDSGVIEKLLAAEERMDPVELFETAHAVKGITANLGLVAISEAASVIAEEYRPGSVRKMNDEEVKEKLAEIRALYERTEEGIRAYSAS